MIISNSVTIKLFLSSNQVLIIWWLFANYHPIMIQLFDDYLMIIWLIIWLIIDWLLIDYLIDYLTSNNYRSTNNAFIIGYSFTYLMIIRLIIRLIISWLFNDYSFSIILSISWVFVLFYDYLIILIRRDDSLSSWAYRSLRAAAEVTHHHQPHHHQPVIITNQSRRKC